MQRWDGQMAPNPRRAPAPSFANRVATCCGGSLLRSQQPRV